MTMRMSTDAWLYWKDNYRDIISLMKRVEIKSNPYLLFKKITTKQALSEKVSKYNARFGSDLGRIFDWLDDICDQPYYVEFKEQPDFYYGGRRDRTEFIFYFMDDADAVSFKIMFFDEEHI